MNNSFSSIGRKPAPPNPGNYIRDYARAKKLGTRHEDDGLNPLRRKLLPSTKPIEVKLPEPDNSISAVGMIALVVFICFSLVTILVLFS